MDRARSRGPVALLPESVARRIAAGEVIERPASVVRELLDNSIDAGASSITVEVDGGGLESIRVDDDGQGMTREDLELCWKPHATSKIETAEDLTHCRTLGFRGEALSSIAAVSRLEVRSRPIGTEKGHRLLVSNNNVEALEPAAASEGTTVTVQGLFYNLPARKRFLKRPQSEGREVRKVLLEKALPEPELRFRLMSDGKERLLLPPGTLEERVSALFANKIAPQSLHRLEGSGEGFTLTVVVADPSQARRDRKQIHTFVNGRRLREFALVQAVEYAFTDVMHGGLYPYAVLLVEVEPELVDFNIHPAKQEARFRNLQEIHHRTVEIIRAFLQSYERKRLSEHTPRSLEGFEPPGGAEARAPAGHSSYSGSFGGLQRSVPGPRRSGTPFDIEEVRRRFGEAADGSEAREQPVSADRQSKPVEPERITYFGQLFDLFLLVAWGNTLYIIDQHASHERLLYDAFRRDRAVQQLIVPVGFEASDDESAALRRNVEAYQEIGICLTEVAPGEWEIRAVPQAFREDSEALVETVLELRGLSEELDRRFTAELACKAAVKRGDVLDEISGEELARRVLGLEQPRCPHGRPLWFSLSEGELFQLIGRT